MANPIQNFIVQIQLNAAQFMTQMNLIQQQIQQATQHGGQQFVNLGNQINRVADGFKNVGQTLTTHLTLPIAAGLGASAKAFIDFEQGLANVKAVSGATAEQMKALEEQAINLGKSTVFSAGEVVTAQEELIKAGLSTEQVLNGGLEGALSLAAAGNIELADAAEIASTVLNSFRDDALSVADAADLLAGAANASATDVGELKYGLSMVSAVAAGVGMSFKDTNTALAVFAQNGLKGSDAGTSLKTMLMNLTPKTKAQYDAFTELNLIQYDLNDGYNYLIKNGVTPASESFEDIDKAMRDYVQNSMGAKEWTDKCEKEFRKITAQVGYSNSAFYDQNGSLRELDDIAGILQKSLKGMSDEQRQQYLYTMFGSDAIRAANILYKEGADGVNKMSDAIGDTTAQEVAAIKMDTLKGSIEQMMGAIETLAIQLGKVLAPGIKKAADKVQELANKFAGLEPWQQEAIVKTGLVIAAIGPMVLIMGSLAGAVGNLVTLFGLFPGLLAGVGSAAIALAAGPLGTLAMAFALISAVAVFMEKDLKKTYDEIEKRNDVHLIDGVSKQTADAIGNFEEMQDRVDQIMMEIAANNGEITDKMAAEITSKMKKMVDDTIAELERAKTEQGKNLEELLAKWGVAETEMAKQTREAVLGDLIQAQENVKQLGKEVDELLKKEKERGYLTKTEQADLNIYMQRLAEENLKVIAKNYKDQQTLLENSYQDREKLSLAEANKISKDTEKIYTAQIEAALEGYKKYEDIYLTHKDSMTDEQRDFFEDMLSNEKINRDKMILDATSYYNRMAKMTYDKLGEEGKYWEFSGRQVLGYLRRKNSDVAAMYNSTHNDLLANVRKYTGEELSEITKNAQKETAVISGKAEDHKKIVGTMYDTVVRIANDMGTPGQQFHQNFIDGVMSQVPGGNKKLADTNTGFKSTLSNKNSLGIYGGEFLTTFTGGVQDAANKDTKTDKGAEEVKRPFSIFGSVTTWGANYVGGWVDGVLKGVTGNEGRVTNYLKRLIRSWIFNSPAEVGPGRFVENWGEGFLGGWMDGVEGALPSAQKDLMGYMGKLQPVMESAFKVDTSSVNNAISAANLQSDAFFNQSMTRNNTIRVEVNGSIKDIVREVKVDISADLQRKAGGRIR
jgi:hypothetical protein